MAAIKPLTDIVEKWIRVTPGRTKDYETGVRNPRTSWSDAAARAKAAWQAGIEAAIARDGFAKGVAAAGDAEWQNAAIEKGTARFGSGVRAAEDKYRRGFEKYHRVIETTALPPRGPTGDLGNYRRSQILGEALHKAKVGG